MNVRKTYLIAAVFIIIQPGMGYSAVSADSPGPSFRPYYFYQNVTYGSQGNFNPANVIINGGYGIWQVYPYVLDRQFIDAPYGEWFANVWDDIRNPFATVNKFGVGKFFTTEVFPARTGINEAQFIPNYFLHLIGAGMLSREMEEWYGARGYKHPRALSVTTMYAYHLLSEIVENRSNTELSVDAVADLYIFDLGGIMLFCSDRVCRFFSGRLGLAEWSLQPAYNWRTGQLENMGQFYIMRYPQRNGEGWSLFVHYGLHGMLGVSHRNAEGGSVSLAAGAMVEDLKEVEQDEPGLIKTADITWAGGIFYDVNNSVMASATFSGYRHNRLRVNLYPGLIKCGWLNPSVFICHNGEWVCGMNVLRLPIGSAFSGNH